MSICGTLNFCDAPGKRVCVCQVLMLSSVARSNQCCDRISGSTVDSVYVTDDSYRLSYDVRGESRFVKIWHFSITASTCMLFACTTIPPIASLAKCTFSHAGCSWTSFRPLVVYMLEVTNKICKEASQGILNCLLVYGMYC